MCFRREDDSNSCGVHISPWSIAPRGGRKTFPVQDTPLEILTPDDEPVGPMQDPSGYCVLSVVLPILFATVP